MSRDRVETSASPLPTPSQVTDAEMEALAGLEPAPRRRSHVPEDPVLDGVSKSGNESLSRSLRSASADWATPARVTPLRSGQRGHRSHPRTNGCEIATPVRVAVPAGGLEPPL